MGQLVKERGVILLHAIEVRHYWHANAVVKLVIAGLISAVLNVRLGASAVHDVRASLDGIEIWRWLCGFLLTRYALALFEVEDRVVATKHGLLLDDLISVLHLTCSELPVNDRTSSRALAHVTAQFSSLAEREPVRGGISAAEQNPH